MTTIILKSPKIVLKNKRKTEEKKVVKKFEIFYGYTYTCIGHLCKFSYHYTLMRRGKQIDKYLILNGLFFLDFGPKFCFFCADCILQYFQTKFYTRMGNTHKYPQKKIRIFLKLLNMFFDFFKISGHKIGRAHV